MHVAGGRRQRKARDSVIRASNFNGLHWRRPHRRHAVGDRVLQRGDGDLKRVDVTGRRAPQRVRRLSTRARLQLVDALGTNDRQLGHAVGVAIAAQLL